MRNNPAPMIVMKFGGTSVGSAAAIRQVLEIVRARREQRPIVVVSAHAGVTDALVDLAERAPKGRADSRAIEQRHREILAELGLPAELLDPLLKDLRDLVRGIRLVGEATPRSRDLLLSFGERCSARTVAAYFSTQGMPSRAFDAGEAGLRTDATFGRARPLPDDGTLRRTLTGRDEIPVVTGFIGADPAGNITTLGRNGSDFSAALIGHAVGAREIQIWKDVDAVMTADPRVVADARPIACMSFGEASELAYYGSKVLHPATIQPAMAGRIPVRVSNTARPDAPGTLILPTHEEPEVVVRAIVHKRGIQVVNVVSPRMLQQHGVLARVFAAAARHEIDVDLVATSEISITMTTDPGVALGPFAAELGEVGEVTVEAGLGLICVVGQGIARAIGVAAQVLTALAEAGIRVRAISQGAIKVNIALVVAGGDVDAAVRVLHARFFPSASAAGDPESGARQRRGGAEGAG
jgi:aspartate kinase